jgi:acyl-[acyl-carrier-protein]-phospholipid O-acyltransferase / long-chain-fatty-acid--[acyl-carrier-protein] ligase
MIKNQFSLFKTRRFFPLFIVQFFGAFNDNVFKNALVIMLTYKLADQLNFNPEIIVSLAAGLFILPFFLFSATAGKIADKYEKSRLIQFIKYAEVALMVGASIGFYLNSIFILMIILFGLGAQSSFFGPIKYGILPEHLKEDELISGNGLISSGTFLSILLGTLIGGLLILASNGIWVIAVITIGSSLLGLAGSFLIPKTKNQDDSLTISLNFIKETITVLKDAKKTRSIFLSIFGISWFWFVGATLLAQFPIYTKSVIGGDETIVTLILAVFSVGIGLGSLLCNRLLKGVVQATYVPFGAFCITVFSLDLFFASQSLSPPAELIHIGTFFQSFVHWRILFDLLFIAIAGGVYVVPLFAILQKNADDTHKSRTIAANNVVNALFMVASAVMCMLLFANGYSVIEIFLVLSILNALVGLYICKLLPDALPKTFLQFLLKLLYRVDVFGLENYSKAGKRVLILANHTSLLDAVLLVAFIPEKLTFAINTNIAKKWWVRPFLLVVNAFAIDPTNPMSTKSLIKLLKTDQKCVIFPEGRITRTGSLMKVHEGPGLIADKSDSMVLPIRIDGAQYSPWSYIKQVVRVQWFPKVTLHILPPQKLTADKDVSGRDRRKIMGEKLYDLMTEMIFNTSNYQKTLYQSLLNAGTIHGWSHRVLEDVERKPATYRQIITRAGILGQVISKTTKISQTVGVMLPSSSAAVVVFWALQAFGRVPAMINFSAGPKNIVSSCKTAKLTCIYTSKRFVKMANLDDVINCLEEEGFDIRYLEDSASSISVFRKLWGFISSKFPNLMYKFRVPVNYRNFQSAAVVLFTSGSEGVPKGVVLSHQNVQANRYQIGSRIDFNRKDIVFNALPMFHSFGLTVGTLLPLLFGIKTFLYPSPLHYRVVPELVYDINATIMFGTNSFLAGYAKYAHPYDFYSIRYIFAGAEKLQDNVRNLWQNKFGIRILEGYGATETSPVIAINTPMQNKAGTVGRLLPEISSRLEPVPGVADAGRLVISGPNIMLGYWLAENPGVLLKPKDGLYDTGDIVSIDDAGFITIRGRAKRFAKIGGEMVSLTAVEESISNLSPKFLHAVISDVDEKKGEKLILITEDAAIDRKAITHFFKQNGVPELSIPKKIEFVNKMSLLGTGKIDYVQLQSDYRAS